MSRGTDTALYQTILNDIEGRIISGEWEPGHKLPFEIQIAAQYDCSRMTVNKALTQLARAGLIERRRKGGSFVRRPQTHSAVLELNDIQAEVESLGAVYSFVILSCRKRRSNAADRAVFDVGAETELLEILCLHCAGNRKFCLEERYINLDAVPEAMSVDFDVMPPGRWLREQIPWSAAEHRIYARTAKGPMAKHLELPRSTAVLVMERKTWGSLGPITFVRLTYNGEMHFLEARFTPAS